jgi:serine/threonine-protein kinase
MEAGHPFLVMPLVAGPSLREELARRGRLSLREAVDLLAQVADALAAAHAAGIIHRDVKPENILLDTSGPTRRALLADFGIAASRDGPI